MRTKCSATVIYRESDSGACCLHFEVIPRRSTDRMQFSLLSYVNFDENVKPYYSSFHELYSFLLRYLKVNGFEPVYYDAFGSRFYDILFIDADTLKAQKFGYKENDDVQS